MTARPLIRTEQELFNAVYLGLASQWFKQSVHSLEDQPNYKLQCAYRGKDGLKCAIGHCIPDSMYDPKIEDKGVNDRTSVFVEQFFARIFEPELHSAASGWQTIHDMNSKPDQLKAALEAEATMKRLTIPVIPDAS